MSYGGVALAVDADVVVLTQGLLDGTGQASVGLIPPLHGTVLDRYYLQAATSPSADFLPLAMSAGFVIRNGDLVSGLAGPAGPVGPMGPVGPTGSAGPAGPTGAAGVVATNAAGAYDFSDVNGFVAPGTLVSGTLGASGEGARIGSNTTASGFGITATGNNASTNGMAGAGGRNMLGRPNRTS